MVGLTEKLPTFVSHTAWQRAPPKIHTSLSNVRHAGALELQRSQRDLAAGSQPESQAWAHDVLLCGDKGDCITKSPRTVTRACVGTIRRIVANEIGKLGILLHVPEAQLQTGTLL
jgi:hypothetical protein